jgi:hypothetical protein
MCEAVERDVIAPEEEDIRVEPDEDRRQAPEQSRLGERGRRESPTRAPLHGAARIQTLDLEPVLHDAQASLQTDRVCRPSRPAGSIDYALARSKRCRQPT